MRRIAVSVFLSGLFLLMLSALIVTPGDAQTPPVLTPAENFHAVFMPLPEVPAPAAADAPDSRMHAGFTNACAYAASPVQVAPAHCRDSNGRVLGVRRYENCVYQLFRPEVAGG